MLNSNFEVRNITIEKKFYVSVSDKFSKYGIFEKLFLIVCNKDISGHPGLFCKKSVLKFFSKFSRTLILKNIFERLLLITLQISHTRFKLAKSGKN